MKKIILLLSIIPFIFTSCSSDEAQQAPQEILNSNGTKIKKVIVNYSQGTYSREYKYNGDKLSRTTSKSANGGASHIDYTYTGNLITRLDFYRNNIKTEITFLEYENGKLTKTTRFGGVYGYKHIYTYNSDGTVTIVRYMGDPVNQNTFIYRYEVFFQNGVVSKIETYNSNGILRTTEYTYDDKNDPFQAILGFDKLTLYEVDTEIYSPNFYTTSSNNTALITTIAPYSTPQVNVRSYEYNSYNFPKKTTSIYQGETATFKYYYY